MEKWYYKDNETEIGPVSITSLKQLASDKMISKSTLVRRENMRSWLFAGKVKGLLTVEPIELNHSAADSGSSEVLPKIVGTMEKPKESVSSRMFASILATAVLAAKEAQLKKLEWDRSAADERLGSTIFSGRHGKAENAKCITRIEEIDRIVIELHQAELIRDGESAKNKALRYGAEANKKIQIESLLAERRRLLRDLGAVFRKLSNDTVPIDVRSGHAIAKDYDKKIEKIEVEIAEIDSPAKGVVGKLKFYAVVCFAMAGILLVTYVASSLLR